LQAFDWNALQLVQQMNNLFAGQQYDPGGVFFAIWSKADRPKLVALMRSDFVFSAGCNSRSQIYNLRSFAGVLAQLVSASMASLPDGGIPIYSDLI
jgi:hypothetical protein